MTMKYCQISDLVLPQSVIYYTLGTAPERMSISSGIVKRERECFSSQVRYQNGELLQ